MEPKDVVKNWMRLKNTLEYLGLWEQLKNPLFKGVEFDPLLKDAGSNAFTMSPSRWIELTQAKGIISKNGPGGGTYAQRDIAFKFASWVSVEFELYLIKEFQRLKEDENDKSNSNLWIWKQSPDEKEEKEEKEEKQSQEDENNKSNLNCWNWNIKSYLGFYEKTKEHH